MLMIGEHLSRLRKNKGLTQKALSEKIGVTEQAVSKWERNKSYPSTEILVSLVNILECSYNDIFDYSPGEIQYATAQKNKITSKVEACISPDTIVLEFGQDFIQLFTDPKHKGFESVQDLRLSMAQKYGVILPMIRLRDRLDLDKDVYEISIRGQVILSSSMDVDREVKPVAKMMHDLETCLVDKIGSLITLQYVYDVVEIVSKKNPILKGYIVPDRVSYKTLKTVLRGLVEDKGVCIKDMVYIIEAIDSLQGCDADMVEEISKGLVKFRP